jgi:hypothetical protein
MKLSASAERKLRGDHCKCPTCGEYFNSTRAFDKHRTGEYGARRCLSPDDMRVRGMVVSATGWWLTMASTRPILHTPGEPFLGSLAIQGAAIGSTPCPGGSPIQEPPRIPLFDATAAVGRHPL